MRVEIARPSSFMTRRSMVRAIRLVTMRKPAMTTMPLSSAHRLNLALPGIMSMSSRVRSSPLNQPSTWKEIAAQRTKVSLSSQARNQLLGPSETEMTCNTKRTSTSTVARSMAMSMSSTRNWKLANAARRPRISASARNDGASTMPAITMRRGQGFRSERAASGRSHRLMYCASAVASSPAAIRAITSNMTSGVVSCSKVCFTMLRRSGVQVRDQLALETRNLVLEDELAFF